MSNTITSNTIGQLIQDAHFPDWWKSEKTDVPFLDNEKLTVTFTDFEPENDKTFVDDADRALKNFLSLSQKDREAISSLVYKNCLDTLNTAPINETLQHLLHLKNANEIWNHIYPSQIYVTRGTEKDQDVYVQVGCGCDWEEEHGLQLVFKQGNQLTRVSEIDGYLTNEEASTKSNEENGLLSQF